MSKLKTLKELKEEDIRKIAEKEGVNYHHSDVFSSPRYIDDSDLKNAVVVIYSSKYGHWQMAINEDGTISKRCKHMDCFINWAGQIECRDCKKVS